MSTMGKRSVEINSQTGVVPPLEDLLPRILPAGEGIDLKVSNHHFFHTKFIHGGQGREQQSRILTLRFVFDGTNERHDVPLYETSEVDTIMLIEIKEPEKVTPTTFQGEIGERVMRATLDVLLERAKQRHQGFDYKIRRGDPREIIGISEHELIAFGKFANIFIYRTIPVDGESGTRRLLTNPLWSPDPEQVRERIRTKFQKEHFRSCFDNVKGEIDALVWWSYAPSGVSPRQGFIVCEAKAGALRQHTTKLNLTELDQKLEIVRRVFPDHEIAYLVMATPDYLYHHERIEAEGRKVVVPNIRTLHEHLTAQGIPLMLLDFQFTSDYLYRKGQFIFDRYRRSQRSAGPYRWVEGWGRIERRKGVMDIHFGGHREIYRRNGDGRWELFQEPQRP